LESQTDQQHYDKWEQVKRYIRIPKRYRQILSEYGLELWAKKAIAAALAMSGTNTFDVMISASGYGHLPALTIKKHLRTPWIANWNDPFPEETYPPPYGSGVTSLQKTKLAGWISDVCRDCDWHTFPCDRLRRFMAVYLQHDVLNRSTVVPHAAPLYARPTGPLAQGERFVITYAGALGAQRPISRFFEAVNMVQVKRGAAERLTIRFLGTDPDQLCPHVENAASGVNIEIVGRLPHQACLTELSQSHILLVVEAEVPEGIFLPTKVVDYASVGRPILALSPSTGTLVDVLTAYGGGIAVDNKSTEQIASALEQLLVAWRTGRLDEQYSPVRLREVFSTKRVSELYSRIFETISSAPVETTRLQSE
jgi:glycosyltransferase involved in cell wall biosynthesis